MGYYLMYLRKSRADVEKERYGRYETLAIHERELTALAAREGYRIEEVYRELVSGESIDGRPEFRRVMDRIADPDCDGVIVHAVDRLGRGDPMEYGWILSSLRYSRTVIVTPGRTYDPRSPDDLQALKLQMFVANIELEHIRARMQAGSVASAERGNYVGSRPPYGYDKVRGRSVIVPNEAEAPVVRMIYRMAAGGSNKGQISRALNADGITTRHGHLWIPARVGTIIENPVYKGWIRYGYRRERIVARDGLRFVRRRVVSDDGTYVMVQGVHEPLVDEGTWEAAQGVFEATPVHRDLSIKNPLAGLLVCGICGRGMSRQVVRNKYGSEYERVHHAYEGDCHCRSASLPDVVSALCEALAEAARELEVGASSRGVDPEEVRALERAIVEEDRRLDKLLELYYAEAITVAELKARRDASDERASQLRARYDELVARDVDVTRVASTTRDVIRMLGDGAVSAEAKNDALRGIVSRVEYWREDRRDGEITLRVHLRGLD